MKKRELFADLQEGLDALSDPRTGKQKLRAHIVEDYVVSMVTAEELVSLRNRLNLSRPVFANYLSTNPRILESWEKGRTKPNAQAALLIRLVESYPDTVARLVSVS